MSLEHFMAKNFPVKGRYLPDYCSIGRNFRGTESAKWCDIASQILEAQHLPYHCGSITLGDGNCFFHALVDQLKDDEIRCTISERASQLIQEAPFCHNDWNLYMTFRTAIVEYCRNDEELNKSEWGTIWKAEFLCNMQKHFPKLPHDKLWDRCLRQMSQEGEYATALFIRATALFFEKDIVVIEEETNYRILGTHSGVSKNPPMAMVHMCRIHFQSALRNQNEAQTSQARQAVPRGSKVSGDDSSIGKCAGCGTIVKQIRLHLAKVPACKEFYLEDKLSKESLDKRKSSKTTYSVVKQDESKQKKNDYEKSVAEKKSLRTKDSISYDYNAPRKFKQAKIKEFFREKEASRFVKEPMDGSDGKCHHCDTAFASIAHAKLHAEEVHGHKKYQCLQCSKEFTRQNDLARHKASGHGDSKEFVCPYCETTLSRKDKLVQHIRDIHEKRKDFKCPKCPLIFARKDTLEKHIIRATADPTKHGVEEHCAGCGKDFIFPTVIAYRNQRYEKGTFHDNCPYEK